MRFIIVFNFCSTIMTIIHTVHRKYSPKSAILTILSGPLLVSKQFLIGKKCDIVSGSVVRLPSNVVALAMVLIVIECLELDESLIMRHQVQDNDYDDGDDDDYENGNLAAMSL